MENEKNLDLSLGLPCRGSNSSQKDNHGSSSDIRSNKDDRDIKIINDFKTFLEGGNGTQQHFTKIDDDKPSNKSAKSPVESETSKNSNTIGMWWSNTDPEEEKRSSTSEKRKNLFTEANQQKKQERETNVHDSTDKTKTSHISITTDEGSTADNEDVADSEMTGSALRQVTQRDDVSNQFASIGGISRAQKDIYGGQSGVEFFGQRRFTISSDKELNLTKTTKPYVIPYQGQPVNMNVMAGTSGDGPSLVSGKFPLTFGYSSVQLPVLDRDNSREDGKSSGKQQIGEEGSLSRTEHDPTGHNSARQVIKDSSSDQPRTESIPTDFPAIKPGIAADIKFGGCGSSPNLPWVSTTGSGPHGRTISGVTYRFSATQIRIVCACHGSHMSPEDFVRHASEENGAPSDGLASFPGSNNPAASAHG